MFKNGFFSGMFHINDDGKLDSFEYGSKSGITIFADDKCFPNKVVFRKVLKQLGMISLYA